VKSTSNSKTCENKVGPGGPTGPSGPVHPSKRRKAEKMANGFMFLFLLFQILGQN